jgi:hypothetical protein
MSDYQHGKLYVYDGKSNTFEEPLPPGTIGPTGDYPLGKLNASDEGGLSIALTREGNNIVINFNTPVAWLALPLQQAEVFARTILKRIKR